MHSILFALPLAQVSGPKKIGSINKTGQAIIAWQNDKGTLTMDYQFKEAGVFSIAGFMDTGGNVIGQWYDKTERINNLR